MNNGYVYNVRYSQGATREGTGALDLDHPIFLEGRRGSRSVAYHVYGRVLYKGKGKINNPTNGGAFA
jgi:hypothetical protein